MKFAYADPPYPGQSKRWYGNHPDYAGEVDHAELIKRLCADYPDGWALSTSSNALQQVLALCPSDVQVAIWHVTNRQLRGNGRWEKRWEPVIVRGGRREHGSAPNVRDLLECGTAGSAARFPGAKPPAFTRWVLALLGAEPADTVDDLFPGSGAVADAIESWRAHPRLPVPRMNAIESQKKGGAKKLRAEHRRTGQPMLGES